MAGNPPHAPRPWPRRRWLSRMLALTGTAARAGTCGIGAALASARTTLAKASAEPAAPGATAEGRVQPPAHGEVAATLHTGKEASDGAIQARRAVPLEAARTPLRFPTDFGSHPDSRTEWWYLTGWLADAREAGQPRLGFQITFFRSRNDVSAAASSAFAARQLIFAHAAITDLQAGVQQHDQRIARAGLGIAEAAVGDSRVHLRDWQLARQDAGPQAERASRYTARVGSDALGGTLQLQVATTQPVLLQGEAGWSRKGSTPAHASRYYSQPQLAVQATWSPRGQAAQTLTGTAWLDHEWSEALLEPGVVGWDWIGMNLFDGSALTAFRLRRADGSMSWAGGSWRAGPAGAAPSRSFSATEVRFEPGRRWTSPATRAAYPVEWQVDTPAGRFRVRALLDGQELDSRGSTGAVYWEGLSELLTPRGERVGLGYLEMTGHAGALNL